MGWPAATLLLLLSCSIVSSAQKGIPNRNAACGFERGDCPTWTSVCHGRRPCSWKRVKAKDAQEGPVADHTTGGGDGWYSRAVFPATAAGRTAVLQSSTSGPLCFTAWLHISALKLPDVTFASIQTTKVLWLVPTRKERVFFRGRVNERRQWQRVVYEEERDGKIEIQVRAGYTSGIVAVDDLSVTPGRCPQPPLDGSCSFEYSRCNYTNVERNNQYKWEHIVLRKNSKSGMAPQDHTTGTADGAYTAYWIPKGKESSGNLASPVLSKGENRCLRFFYFVPQASPQRGLLVRLIRNLQPGLRSSLQRNLTTEEKDETLWHMTSSLLPSRWAPAEVSYSAKKEHMLQFQCHSSKGMGTPFFCALDDIEVFPCGDKKGEKISCGFNDGHLCGWETSSEPGAVPWVLSDVANGLPQLPRQDHAQGTSQGQFVYAENEAHNDVVKATLVSPVLDPEWIGAACLSFWHFAVTEDPKSCNLTVVSGNESEWWSGSEQLKRSWNREVIRIWLQGGKRQVSIEARLGTGLIALDDIALAYGQCPSERRGLSCDFERGPCTWTNSRNKRGRSKWFVHGGWLRSTLPRPPVDHTRGTSQGSYLFLSGGRPPSPYTAQILSEVVDLGPPGIQCMDFWYMIRGPGVTQLKVVVYEQSRKGNWLQNLVWNAGASNSSGWQRGQVKIPRKARVMLEGQVKHTKENYIAVDDISIDINGNCRTLPKEAVSGNQAYVLLDCSWSSPGLCRWVEANFTNVLKNSISTPPKFLLAPTSAAADDGGAFEYAACDNQRSATKVTAVLRSADVLPQENFVCLRFGVHMFSADGWQLKLSQFYGAKENILFLSTGRTTADRWYTVTRTVSFAGNTKSALQFIFNNVRCQSGGVALGDIHVTPGTCSAADGRGLCDFNFDTCEWKAEGSWKRVLFTNDKRLSDARMISGSPFHGSYMLLTRSQSKDSGGPLSSPLWAARHHPRFLEFWYIHDKSRAANVLVQLQSASGEVIATVWRVPDTSPAMAWNLARIEISRQAKDFKVVFQGKLPREAEFFALDDVRLSMLPSSHVANCNFEEDLCGYANVVGSDKNFRWFVGTGRVQKPALKPLVPAVPLVGLSQGLEASKTFAYVDTTVPLLSGANTSTLTLRSPVFTPRPNDTLLLRYFRNGSAIESFTVRQFVWNKGDPKTKLVLLGSLPDVEDWQDFEAILHEATESQIHVTVTRSRQQGGFAAVASVSVGHSRSVVPDKPKPTVDMNCTFENASYCKWKVERASSSTLEWKFNDPSNHYPAFPNFDHTTKGYKGHYIYAENNGSDVATARLQSPPVPAVWLQDMCLSFWYFTLTDTKSSLRVSLSTASDAVWNSTSPQLVTWTHGQVQFAESTTKGDTRVVLEAAIRSGLVAVDDLTAISEPCSPTSHCSFEGGINCELEPDMNNVRDWDVVEGSALDVRDHSTDTFKGHFLYLNTTFVEQKLHSFGRLFLPERGATDATCLTFWWRAVGVPSVLNVYRFHQKAGLRDPVLSLTATENPWWNARVVTISSKKTWQVAFEVLVPEMVLEESGVFLDDIELVDGNCSPENYCSFETPTCLHWKQSDKSEANSRWMLQRAGLSLIPRDHTLKSHEGHYLLFKEDKPEQTARLLLTDHRYQCASLWHYISPAPENLTVMAGNVGLVASTDDQWMEVMFAVDPKETAISAISGKRPDAFAAIDDLLLREEPCYKQATVVSPPFECAGSRKTVPARARCNFIRDCPDGSDEMDCGSCSFENGTCGWSLDGQGLIRSDDFHWERRKAAASSGPPKDHTTSSKRGYYLLLQTSKPIEGMTSIGEASSPTLHNSGHLCVVKFWFNIHGLNDADLLLWDVRVNGFHTVAWDSWYLADSPTEGKWNEGRFLLGRYRSALQIYLRGYKSSSNRSYTAVDDISFEDCAMPVPSAKPNPGMFTCKNKVQVLMEHRCDYIDHCGDFSDEEDCDEFRFRCNFDSSFCDWTPEESASRVSWTRVKPFRFLKQGPTRDHTSGSKDGSFLYLKSKGKSLSASIFGPVLQNSTVCMMRFYYTMQGRSNAQLTVKTRSAADGEFKEVWKSDRPTEFAHFSEAFVSFHEETDFQVAIEGILEGGKDADAYIAIDDVTFLDSCHPAPGPLPKGPAETSTPAPSNCTSGQFACLTGGHCIPKGQLCDFREQCPDGSDESHCGACDFSRDMCGLETARSQSQPRWTRVSALMVANNRARFPTLPREDSGHSERGFYAAYVKFDRAVPTGRTTALMTPPLGPIGHACRLSFYAAVPKQLELSHIVVSVVEGARGPSRPPLKQRDLLTIWDDEGQFSWKAQAVNIGNYLPGARIYFRAAENASIDDIEYHHCHPDDTREDSLNCTFEEKEGCGWYPENVVASGDWTMVSGAPDFAVPDHTTGSGMYLELSNYGPRAITAHMVSATVNATGTAGRCFRMWYHMREADNCRLTLRLYNMSDPGSRLWTKIGHQGVTWMEAAINVNVTDAPFKLLLEGELPGGSPFFIGVDDISFDEQPCPPTSTCDFEEGPCDWALEGWVLDNGKKFSTVPTDHTTGTSTGTFARLNAQSGRLLSAPHDLSGAERRCFRFWHFFRGEREEALSVYKHATEPTEDRELLWTIHGEDRPPQRWLSASVNVAVNYSSSVRLEISGECPTGNGSALAVDDLLLSGWACPRRGSCSFEDDLCDWRNVADPKDLAWHRWSGPTLSRSGPATDHTLATRHGHFLFLDAMEAADNRVGVIESDLLYYSPSSCLQFYYYVNTKGTQARLFVEYAQGGKVFRRVEVLEMTRPEGWQLFRHFFDWLPASYNIRITGYPGNDEPVNIAIDDIEVFDRKCPEASPVDEAPAESRNSTIWDCDFDMNLCSWNQSENTWIIRSGRTAVAMREGPHMDSQLRSAEGKYLYYSPRSWSLDNLLTSPALRPSKQDYCVQFWYFLYSLAPAQLLVGLSKTTSGTVDQVSWLQRRGSDRIWRRGSFTVKGEDAEGKRLAVHVQQQEFRLSEIALDQMRAAPTGTCSHPVGSLCDFEGDGFCGFKVDSTGGGRWRIVGTNKRTAALSSQYRDHTFWPSHGGHFLLLHLDQQKGKKDTPYAASLVLPNQAPTQARCLTLWYFFDGTGIGHLNVSVRAPGSTAFEVQEMLYGVPSTGWLYGSATIQSASLHEVLLTAEVERGALVAVGLDDISITDGRCPEPGHCDFEGPDLCGWQNADNSVQRLWARNRGSTPMPSSGPRADHTLKTAEGTYLYIDGRNSSGGKNYTGILKSQLLRGSSDYCFSFWLHMSGTGVGSGTSSLRVSIVYFDQGKEKREPLMSITGSQGMEWSRKRIPVNYGPSSPSEFSILVAGTTGGPEGGDIALDDVEISAGTCDPKLEAHKFRCHDGITLLNISQVCDFKKDCPKNGDDEQLCGQCDFDIDSCGWFSNPDPAAWSWTIAKNAGRMPLLPSKDQSRGDESGGYIYGAGHAFQVGARKFLKSPNGTHQLKRSAKDCTLTFWYFTSGYSNELSVHKHILGYDATVWLVSSDGSEIWTKGEAAIGRSYSEFGLAFETISGLPPSETFTAIDNINFDNCALPEPSYDNVNCSDGFLCVETNVCISKSRLCDHNDDCGDGSDETLENCRNYTSCTYEPGSDVCAWQPGNDDRKKGSLAWRVSTVPYQKVDPNTGPYVDHTKAGTASGRLLLLRPRQRPHLNGSAVYRSPNYIARNGSCILTLHYYLHGRDIGGIALFAQYQNYTQKPQWERLLEFKGDRGQRWIRASAFVHTDKPFCFVLEGTVGSGYASDIAVDDIAVSPGCGLYNDVLPNPPPPPMPQCKSSQYACKDGGCIPYQQVCDFEPDCPDGSDEEMCGPCNFENGTCGWFDESEGMISWQIMQARDLPELGKDHTTKLPDGHFVALKNEGGSASTALLLSPQLPPSSSRCLMRFWYFYPKVIKGVKLSLHHAVSRTKNVALADVSPANGWAEMVVHVPQSDSRSARIALRARVQKLHTLRSIAIDDISFTDCRPSSVLVDCSFDNRNFYNGLCHWRNTLTSGNGWKVAFPGEDYDGVGPTADHTSGRGGYALFSLKEGLAPGTVVSLESAKVKPQKSNISCLSFWYSMNTAESLNLVVTVNSIQNSTAKFSRKSVRKRGWNFGELLVSLQEPYTVKISAVATYKPAVYAFLAIDDVVLTEGSCHRAAFCDFETDFCNWEPSKEGLSDGWTRLSAAAHPSAGPALDHSLQTADGHYVLFAPKRQGDKASLFSPVFEKTGNRCFRFWFNMAGKSVGTLSVYQWLNGSSSVDNTKPVWKRSGDQLGAWRQGHVMLRTRDAYQVVIEAFTATYNSRNASYIALDDVEFSLEPCEETVTCSFESDSCGWLSNTTDSYLPWVRTTGFAGVTLGGPKTDVTTASPHGSYMLASASNTSQGAEIVLVSDTVDIQHQSGYCFSLWYNFRNSINSSLLVKRLKHGEVESVEVLATLSRKIIWTKYSLASQTGQEQQLSFHLVAKLGGQSNASTPSGIAVDEVEFFYGSCEEGRRPAVSAEAAPTYPPHPLDCDFEDDDCAWNCTGSSHSVWVRMRASSHHGLEHVLPETDHTTKSVYGSFAYLDFAFPNVSNNFFAGENAILSSQFPLHVSGDGACVKFWFFALGSSVEPLTLWERDAITGASRGIWTNAGSKGPQWNYAQVRLEGDRALFLAFRSSKSRDGHTALDDIAVNSGNCPTPAICDFEADDCGWRAREGTENLRWQRLTALAATNGSDHTLNSEYGHVFGVNTSSEEAQKGVIITTFSPTQEKANRCVRFWYQLSSGHKLSVGTSQGVTMRTEATFKESPLVATFGWHPAQVNLKFLPAALFEYFLQVTLDGTGGIVTVDDIQAHSICPSLGSCDFEEDFCFWENEPQAPQGAVWDRIPGRFHMFGPDVDHTLGASYGTYAAIGSTGNTIDAPSYLLSPLLTDCNNICFSFWSHHSGTLPHMLSLFLRTEFGDEIIEHFAASDVSARWVEARANISTDAAECRIGFKVVFPARHAAVFAVDDLVVSGGPCGLLEDTNLPVFSCDNETKHLTRDRLCNFEADCLDGKDEEHCGTECDFESKDTCSWKATGLGAVWAPEQARNNALREPVGDHSISSDMGTFLRLKVWPAYENERTAEVASPNLIDASPTCTLGFWYYNTLSLQSTAVKVTYKMLSKLRLEDTTVLVLRGHNGTLERQKWRYATARIGRVSERFSVKFVGRFESFDETFSIDDLKFFGCDRNSVAGTVKQCPPHFFTCANRNCIRKNLVCDFNDDCGDMSDESSSQRANCARFPGRCNFEDSVCDWQVNTSAWELRLVPKLRNSFSADDLRDHTTNTVYGNFLRFTFFKNLAEKAEFSSPIVNVAKGTPCFLRFFYAYQTRFSHLDYGLYSLNAGSLAVYARSDLLGAKRLLWKTSQVFGQYYERKIIPIKDFSNPLQIVIEATSGDDIDGAWAIDDISFTDSCIISSVQALPVLALEATTERPLGFCKPTEFACPDQTCIPSTRVCDFAADCKGGADEAVCATCDFNSGTCGWRDTSVGRYSWQRLKSGDNETGPSSDFTGNGFFMAVRPGSGVVSDTAVLTSTEHGPSAATCYLEMFYYASSVPERAEILRLSVIEKNSSKTTLLALRTSETGKWKRVTVGIGRRIHGGWNLRLEATPPTPQSGISVDQISLLQCGRQAPLGSDCESKGQFSCKGSPNVCFQKSQMCDWNLDCPDGYDEVNCSRFPERCSFEDGFCGWQEFGEGASRWSIINGSLGAERNGPGFDHTFKNESGHFLFMKNKEPKNQAGLKSVSFKSTTTLKCRLRFWYMINEHAELDIWISYKIQSHLLKKITALNENGTDSEWQKVDLALSSPDDFEVGFKGSLQGSIAIDDVSFTPECSVSPSSVVPTVYPATQCNNETEFRCKDNSCIPREMTCDFKADCPFGADESTCPSSCSFEQGDCGWNSPDLPQRVGWRSMTAMEAVEKAKNSPSKDVTTNSSSGHYLFFYMAYDGDRIENPIRMLSPSFQQSTPDCKVTFYHWLTLPIIHVRLLVVENGSEDLLLWERTSERLAESWTLEKVGIGRRKNPFRLAFEIGSPSRGPDLEFALDELRFVDCGYPKNGKFSGDSCEERGSFKCKSRLFCVAGEKRCDLYDDCGDGSDEEECSNQRITFDDEKTGVLKLGNPKREETEGSLQFERGRSPLRKEDDTGALFDHTTFNNSGAYLQFGGVFHGFNKMAMLSSMTLLAGECRVTFHSYMFGRQVNSLSLHMRYFKDSSNAAKEVWHRDGSQGDFWERQHSDLSDLKDRQLVFVVRSGNGPKDAIALDDISFSQNCRFTSRSLPDEPMTTTSPAPATPRPGKCEREQFACLSDGLCVSADRVCDFREDCADGSDEKDCLLPSCGFNNGSLCGWAVTNNASLLGHAVGTARFTTYSLENDFTWKVIQASDQLEKANRALRPNIDHSEGTQEGWYALANSAFGGETDASLLYSPHPLSRTAGGCRLQAWYYCSDDCRLQLLLYPSTGSVSERPLWTAFRARPKQWTPLKASIGIVRGARLAWRAQSGRNKQAVQALDDLEFLSCEPPTIRNDTCPDEKFRCIGDNWCIERSRLCDQTWDCEDGSDETEVACSAVRSRCTFEDVHCEDWTNEASLAARLLWSRRIASTAETNLPLTDHTTSSGQGAYMAVYRPWGVASGVTSRGRLVSYVISRKSKLPCHVRFWYNVPMRGVSLDIYRQTSLGDDGNSHVATLPVAGADIWDHADIDLGTPKEDFRVIIEALYTASAGQQGAAIDDITLTDGCLKSDRELPGTASANTTQLECGSERFPCKDGGCYLPSQRCNFISDCQDATDEKDCGSSCDFENDFCGWYNSLSVQEHWRRTSGNPGDHTLGNTKGHYLSTNDASKKATPGARAQLHSKFFRESGPECSFSFWYYTAEKFSIGSLNVYVKQAKPAPKVDQVFSAAGREMAQNRWVPASIRLGKRVEFGLILEAVWAAKGRGAALYLDDFSYQKCRPDHHASGCGDSDWMCANRVQCVAQFERCDGKRDCSDGSDERDCVRGFGDCSFDDENWEEVCKWTVENIAGKPSWKRAKKSHSEDTGPPSSHLGTPEAHFLLANSTELPLGSVAVARTPKFPSSQDKCHLRFWYFMKGSPSMEFLRVETEANGSRLPMWQELGPQGDLWTYAHVVVGHQQPFNVVFLAQRGGDALTDIAIDEVSFTPSCFEGGVANTSQHTSLCTKDEFLCADKRMCIPRSFVCDCEDDCEDGSDETDCGMKCKTRGTTPSGKATGRPLSPDPSAMSSTPSSGCAPSTFSCGGEDGGCIAALLLCDGVPDCPDGEDERQCDSRSFCPDDYYYCRDPRSCLHRSKLCDGRGDCSDGSDESLCNGCPGYFCRNKGNCSSTRSGAPQCACGAAFGGNRCEREFIVEPASHRAEIHVAGWSYGAPLLALFVIAVLTAALIAWRKRRTETREETAQVTISNPTYGIHLDDVDVSCVQLEGDTPTSTFNALCSEA